MSDALGRPQRWDGYTSFDGGLPDADVDRLLRMAPFRDMDPEGFPRQLPLRGILQHEVRLRRFRRGEIIVRKGDYGTSAFLILSGKTRVVRQPELPPEVLGRREVKPPNLFRVLAQFWNSRHPETRSPAELKSTPTIAASTGTGQDTRIVLQDIPRILDEHRTAVMEAGELFGEISALGRIPRTATVFCDEDAELLEIRWQGLRDLMKHDTQFRARIDEIYRERALASHLRHLPVFSRLKPEELQEVIAQAEFRTFGRYDWSGEYKRSAKQDATAGTAAEPPMVQEGDYVNGLILIRAGFARLSRKFGRGERTLNYLGAGQRYGFEEIAHNWRKRDQPVPYQYSLTAIGYTHVIVIPTHLIESLVLPAIPTESLPPLVVESRERPEPVAPLDARIDPETMEFLAEHRYFNGTAAMVIDMDRCTRCDDCVRACAAAHNNNPRFLRHGLMHRQIMVANACMHCADPVCMIGCPTGAIHRSSFEGEVVINQPTCVGCQSCATNCPYEAIRMVAVRDTQGRVLEDDTDMPILKATKCDLCIDQLGGPACERACPHDALARIDMNHLEQFSRWLRR